MPRYETVAESTNNQGIQPPQSWSSEDLEPWLLEHAASLVTHRDEFSRSVDVFQQGFDRYDTIHSPLKFSCR